jgi:hypothetical protein
MEDLESLKALIRVKNAQIKSLNQELLSETPILSEESGMAQKVIELVKKNKRLIVSLEREKALNASLVIQKDSLKKIQKQPQEIIVQEKKKDQTKSSRDKLGIVIKALIRIGAQKTRG